MGENPEPSRFAFQFDFVKAFNKFSRASRRDSMGNLERNVENPSISVLHSFILLVEQFHFISESIQVVVLVFDYLFEDNLKPFQPNFGAFTIFFHFKGEHLSRAKSVPFNINFQVNLSFIVKSPGFYFLLYSWRKIESNILDYLFDCDFIREAY